MHLCGPWAPVTEAQAGRTKSLQVLYAGGERFDCGVKSCFYGPSANAELYTPSKADG